jgi:hypothetical protein
MGPETRWQFKNDMTLFKPDWKGSHQFKFGVDYNYVEFAADNFGNYAGSWRFPTDRPYDENDPTTYPERYNDALPRADDVPVHHFSVYFQDDWNPRPGLTLNLGLRYDLQKGTFNEDIRDIDFPMEIPFHEGADRRGDANNIGPRIGFAWDVTQTGSTVVKGGYGLFYDNIRTLTNFGERWWHQQQSVIRQRLREPLCEPLQRGCRDHAHTRDCPFSGPHARQELRRPGVGKHQLSVGGA